MERETGVPDPPVSLCGVEKFEDAKTENLFKTAFAKTVEEVVVDMVGLQGLQLPSRIRSMSARSYTDQWGSLVAIRTFSR